VGILSFGISPTSLCACLDSALLQLTMLDVYGTKGGGSNVVRCVMLHLSVISTNRALVFASTTRVARTGMTQAVE
jgi:hypothetical protein